MFNGVSNARAEISYTVNAADTWESIGSFTIPKGAMAFITSSYTVRCTGMGFGTANGLTRPDAGAVEGTNHIGKTPLFWLNAGTYYIYVKSNSTAGSNRYNTYKID